VKRVLQIAAAVVLVLLVGLLIRSVVTTQESRAFVEDVGNGKRPAAPSFDLPALEGDGRVRLDDYRGRPVVINFWASWCDPCKDEAPLLEELAAAEGPDGAAFLGIDAQDLTDDARAFAERYGLTYPLAHDDGDIHERWGVSQFPETFVVDGAGRTIAHWPGPIVSDEDVAELRAAIEEARRA
jgi:cytochrome c biogenesis protein CcmG/thiol:disulfide interchange protein DsbE